MAKDLKIGDTVKLKPGTIIGKIPEGRHNHKTAKVKALLSDTPGGVILDRDLGGVIYWNESDLDFIQSE